MITARRRGHLLAIALLCAWPAAAWAYEPDAHDYDLNGDGRITFEELMQSAGKGSGKMLQKLEPLARKAFNALDRNQDGVLSADDFDDFREGMEKLKRWLEHLQDSFREDSVQEEPLRS